MDNMEMVEAMQDMFITYLKPIQEKIEIGQYGFAISKSGISGKERF